MTTDQKQTQSKTDAGSKPLDWFSKQTDEPDHGGGVEGGIKDHHIAGIVNDVRSALKPEHRDDIRRDTISRAVTSYLDRHHLLYASPTPTERKELAAFKTAFRAAKAFIDSHVTDGNTPEEMCKKYEAYTEATKGLKI